MNYTQQKKDSILLGAILFLFVLTVVGFTLRPHKTHAQLVTADPANIATNVQGNVTSGVGVFATIKNTIKEMGLDKVAYAIGQSAVQKGVNSIIDWSNRGFSGNPFYVDDYKTLFAKAIEKEGARFLTEISDKNILGDSPFTTRQMVDFIKNYTKDPKEALKFTLDQKLGPDWRKFMEGDEFSFVGFEALLEPGNNPILYSLESQKILDKATVGEVANLTTRLTSPGFLSQTECEPGKEIILGSGVEYKEDKLFTSAKYDEEGNKVDNLTEEEIDGIIKTDGEQTSFGGTGTRIHGDPNYKYCAQYKTLTPASIIEKQLSNALYKNIDGQVDEFGEFLKASLFQVLNGIQKAGLRQVETKISSALSVKAPQYQKGDILEESFSGLYGQAQSESNTGQAQGGRYVVGNIDEVVNLRDVLYGRPKYSTQPTLDADGEPVRNGFGEVIYPVKKDASGKTIYEQLPVIEQMNQELTILEEQIDALQSIPEMTFQLDVCLPGIDSGWQERFTNTLESDVQQLQKKTHDWATNRLRVIRKQANNYQQQLKIFNAINKQNIPSARKIEYHISRAQGASSEKQRKIDQLVQKGGALSVLEQIKTTYDGWTIDILYDETGSPLPLNQQTILPDQDELQDILRLYRSVSNQITHIEDIKNLQFELEQMRDVLNTSKALLVQCLDERTKQYIGIEVNDARFTQGEWRNATMFDALTGKHGVDMGNGDRLAEDESQLLRTWSVRHYGEKFIIKALKKLQEDYFVDRTMGVLLEKTDFLPFLKSGGSLTQIAPTLSQGSIVNTNLPSIQGLTDLEFDPIKIKQILTTIDTQYKDTLSTIKPSVTTGVVGGYNVPLGQVTFKKNGTVGSPSVNEVMYYCQLFMPADLAFPWSEDDDDLNVALDDVDKGGTEFRGVNCLSFYSASRGDQEIDF